MPGCCPTALAQRVVRSGHELGEVAAEYRAIAIGLAGGQAALVGHGIVNRGGASLFLVVRRLLQQQAVVVLTRVVWAGHGRQPPARDQEDLGEDLESSSSRSVLI